MAENGRVHPNCVNASNPYHECGMACLEKIAQGQGKKEKKKKLDNHNGIKEDAVSKKKDEQRKVHPNCPKASNPYHECDVLCLKRNGEVNAQGVKKQSGSWSFGRKKKESESQPNSPQIVENSFFGGRTPDARNSQSEHYSGKRVESQNNGSFSPREQYSQEISPQGHSFNRQQVQSTESVPVSGNIVMSNKSKDPPKDSFNSPKDPPKSSVNSPADAMPAKNEKDEKLQVSPVVHPSAEEGIAGSASGSRNFSFLRVDDAVEDSDEEEAESVISDSCVSVGKYHVKSSVASILQSIFDRYGDIAANCKLKSNSMRAYYLECLCSVVQELQATSLTQITKAKVKEMMAVLNDVESAEIDVDWLRKILNEISEAIELITKQQTIENAKSNCDHLLESTKRELETQMKDLALKQKELDEAKARVAETKDRLSLLESELSQLDNAIQSARSKLEKFRSKTLVDELL